MTLNPWLNKSPEERRISAAKGAATRRANRAKRLMEAAEQRQRLSSLQIKIRDLESRLDDLKRFEVMATSSISLTGKSLLREHEIVSESKSWANACGVYFLISDKRIVYVGQSVSIFARIASHSDKQFDSFAFISCEAGVLDRLESLYIHLLQPELNGRHRCGTVNAPISIDNLLRVISS